MSSVTVTTHRKAVIELEDDEIDTMIQLCSDAYNVTAQEQVEDLSRKIRTDLGKAL